MRTSYAAFNCRYSSHSAYRYAAFNCPLHLIPLIDMPLFLAGAPQRSGLTAALQLIPLTDMPLFIAYASHMPILTAALHLIPLIDMPFCIAYAPHILPLTASLHLIPFIDACPARQVLCIYFLLVCFMCGLIRFSSNAATHNLIYCSSFKSEFYAELYFNIFPEGHYYDKW